MGRKPWKPSKVDYYRAYRMKKAGQRDEDVAKMLGVCHASYDRHKADFHQWYKNFHKLEEDRARDEKSRGGSKITMTPKMAEQLVRLAECGFTDMRVCELMGVSQSTLFSWRQIDFEFGEKYRKAKQLADAEVVSALKKRALGFTATSRIETTTLNRAGVVLSRTVQTQTNEIAPNVGALRFWLINRQNWTGENVKPVEKAEDGRYDLSKLTEEEVRQLSGLLGKAMIESVLSGRRTVVPEPEPRVREYDKDYDNDDAADK